MVQLVPVVHVALQAGEAHVQGVRQAPWESGSDAAWTLPGPAGCRLPPNQPVNPNPKLSSPLRHGVQVAVVAVFRQYLPALQSG